MTWEETIIHLKSQPDQKEFVKACFFDDPLIEAADRYYACSEWHAVRQLLSKEKIGTVIDIGAGRGISSYAFARDGWNVTALEPDTSSLIGSGAIRSLFEESDLNINIIESYCENAPLVDNSYDLVHARQSMHHANDLAEYCKSVYRLLKPGGMFISTREHVISKESDLEIFLDSHPLHKLYGGEHAYTLREYLSCLKAAGFQTEVLKPFSSEINLFPLSRPDLLQLIADKIHVRLPKPIFNFLLKIADYFYRKPGMIYTFVCRKLD